MKKKEHRILSTHEEKKKIEDSQHRDRQRVVFEEFLCVRKCNMRLDLIPKRFSLCLSHYLVVNSCAGWEGYDFPPLHFRSA
jgi:hypothetical protein